jgi:hypothetical protein
MAGDVAAHDQRFEHVYTIHYPEHEARANDPFKADFDEYKKRRRADGTYHCDFAAEHRNGDTSECDNAHPLECHHKVIEFAMTNEVDIKLLEAAYPGVRQEGVGKWIDNAENLMLLCRNHHRGHMGVHVASASDFGAEAFIRNLIS